MVDRMEASETSAAPAVAVSSSKRNATSVLETAHVDSGSNSTADERGGVGGEMSMLKETTVLQQPREKDGSVVSAMTDPASIDGNTNYAALPRLITSEHHPQEGCSHDPSRNQNDLLLLGDGMVGADDGVPKQVILADDHADFDNDKVGGSPSSPNSSPSTTPAAEPPDPVEPLVVVTSKPPSQSGEETMSLPERPAPATKNLVSGTTSMRDTDNRSASDAATTPPRVEGTLEEQQHQLGGGDDDGSSMDDYIKSPEVQNAIVERSPGGRYVRFMEKLGSGASKDVYRAYDTQEGIEVAWNVVNLAGVPKQERNRIVNEVRLLERLHHHNIISFHGSWVNRERQEVNFVTEILSSGTLKSFINKVQVIRWKIAKRWAVQILKGLEYLHSQDPPVIHRDLKCENIFINGTSGDLRIGDLGLSTVHRNGRVLSVLGTPEFMAPDMYEQNSYDEKVDVYSFGLCMLEIFTKEIPYSECNNPAQIYKKVSAGEPPEVLSRLQSKHARDFIMLCLGYRDENGNFIRPTVSELLQHEFLVKRANDDDEVEVAPPIRERTIMEHETPSASGTPSKRKDPAMKGPPREVSSQQQRQQGVSQSSKQGVSLSSKQGVSQSCKQGASHSSKQGVSQSSKKDADNPPAVEARLPGPRRIPSTASSNDEEDGGDRFEEMQESEINMRKVKVLMGRGQELKEEEEQQQQQQEEEGTDEDPQDTGSIVSGDRTVDSTMQVALQPPSIIQAPEEPSDRYLVRAVVLEHENPNIRPYDDDILKLVITLPVDGQTQNVQFDFHLVEDDAIQVAKEMVRELDIPQGAVLEISETISGLARTARMRQDRHAVLMKQMAQNQMQQSTHAPMQTAYQQAQGLPQGQQQQQQQQQQNPAQGQHVQHAQAIMQGQQEQTQYHQQPQHGQLEHVPTYQQPPGHARDRSVSQNDMSQFQQASQQPSMQQQVPHPQSQQDFSQFQQHSQHGSNQVQNAQYQQDVPPLQQHVSHQGSMNGGHPQEQTPYQQQQQQQQAPPPLQRQPPMMSGGGQEQPQYQQLGQEQQQQYQQLNTGIQDQQQQQYQQRNAGGQEQPQYGQEQQQQYQQLNTSQQDQYQQQQQQPQQQQQQMYQQAQVHHQVEQGSMHSNSPQESPHQYGQQIASHGSVAQEMQVPLQVQQRRNSREQPQYQPPQQLQPQSHVDHSAMQSGGPQELPHLYQQQRGQQDMQQQAMHNSQAFPPAQQQQPIRQLSGNSEQQIQMQGNPPTVYTQPQQHQQQPQFHAQVSGADPNQQQKPAPVPYSKNIPSSVSPAPPPQQMHSSNVGQKLPPSSTMSAGSTSNTSYQGMPQFMSPAPVSAPVPLLNQPSVPPAQLGASTAGHVEPQGPRGASTTGHGLPRSTSGELNGSSMAKGQSMIREELLPPERSSSQSPKITPRMDSTGTSTSSGGDISASELDSDEDEVEELRRLDEDFQKNLQRAKKVFYNRMDNLQRSQVEREAQHQKTLEKHEKERAEFEKRLAQEEEQQNRRIEQLQREWDKRRETLAKQKRKHKNGQHHSASVSHMSTSQDSLASLPTTTAGSSVPTTGHIRSASSVSSSLSVSPAVTDKKLPQEPKEGQGGSAESN